MGSLKVRLRFYLLKNRAQLTRIIIHSTSFLHRFYIIAEAVEPKTQVESIMAHTLEPGDMEVTAKHKSGHFMPRRRRVCATSPMFELERALRLYAMQPVSPQPWLGSGDATSYINR